MSAGRNTASGHLRAASRIGIPECTPDARASFDAVATTAGQAGFAIAVAVLAAFFVRAGTIQHARGVMR